MDHLLPCPGCARHVRAIDPSCPFCGETLPLSLRQTPPQRRPAKRLGRAATLAFGAALAATGCEESIVALYGAPADAAGLEDAGASSDDAGVVALYGAPADAGPGQDAGAQSDDGGLVAMYGAPSDAGPTDAGRDSGMVVAAYGGPA